MKGWFFEKMLCKNIHIKKEEKKRIMLRKSKEREQWLYLNESCCGEDVDAELRKDIFPLHVRNAARETLSEKLWTE